MCYISVPWHKMSERSLMLPAEMVILLAMAQANDFGREALARPMGDVSGEYIARLYQSLVQRGYLRRAGVREYRLTERGGEALVEFLHRNEHRVRQTIKALELLRINIGRGGNWGRREAVVAGHRG
jgi:predicted transcriptional regulator